MCESFKINVYFDEKGEEIENLISYFWYIREKRLINFYYFSIWIP